MSWKTYRLGDILERKRVSVKIEKDKLYKLVTIKLYHQGVILREERKGDDIKSNMFYVNTGDFILSGIDARNGAFGIVPKELDGAIVTNDFWILEPNPEIMRKDFFLFITSTPLFDYICKQCSDGTTQRIRLQRDKFYDYELSLPSIDEQQLLVDKLTNYNQNSKQLYAELTHQLTLVKQLRQSFLREAMQGKLTADFRSAHPELTEGENSAQALLEKIKAEKKQLIKDGKLKKEKELSPVSEDEIPFEIPEGWVWCRLNEICTDIIDCPHSTPQYLGYETGFYGIDTNCINEKREIVQLRPLSKESYEARTKRIVPKKDDIIYAREGSIGLSVILKDDTKICLGQRVMLFRAHITINKDFLLNVVTDENYKNRLLEKHRGMGAKHVNVKDIVNSLIPLPPLFEQQAIVSKLDELMRTCDELEASIRTSQQQNEMLLREVLREALEG